MAGGAAQIMESERQSKPWSGHGIPVNQATWNQATVEGSLKIGLRRLIERHGGYLTITSALYKGTKICLDFPVPTPTGRREILAKDVFLTDAGVAPA